MAGKLGSMFGSQEEAAREEVEAEVSVVHTEAPAPHRQTPNQMKTVLGAGCSVEGKLVCSGPTQIDGRVTGEVEADDLVVVDEGATVIADLNVQEISVKGNVKGNITAGKRVCLARSAQIDGDIRTPSLTIEEGAQIQGKIEVEPKMKEVPENRAGALLSQTPVPSSTNSTSSPEVFEEHTALAEPDSVRPSRLFDRSADAGETEITFPQQ